MRNFISKSLLVVASIVMVHSGAIANESVASGPGKSWSWTGIFGSYDKEKAQRGLQVYTEVCSGCHALSLFPMRELSKLGYDEAQIKGFAAKFEVPAGIADGKVVKRKATPADALPNPFGSEEEARAANNGALPPDLSLIINSRARGRGNFFLNLWDAITIQGNASGADYVYHLLQGYGPAPADMTMGQNMNYNKTFPGNQIAMPQPLNDGQVTYSDGTKASVAQMSEDVVNFLAIVSLPNLEMQKQTGLKVMIFLIVFVVLLIATKRRIWKDIH